MQCKSVLAMEGTESTTRESTAQKIGNQEVDQMVLMSSKPLHRFVQKEPRSLGVTQQSTTDISTDIYVYTNNCKAGTLILPLLLPRLLL